MQNQCISLAFRDTVIPVILHNQLLLGGLNFSNFQAVCGLSCWQYLLRRRPRLKYDPGPQDLQRHTLPFMAP